MTISMNEREENQRLAFKLMIQELGDRAFDTSLFDATTTQFESKVLRTTWEELLRLGYIECVTSNCYRLTAQGWLVALEASGVTQRGLRKTGHVIK